MPNNQLCGTLGMTPPTLIKARQELQKRGLITFVSGAKKRTTPKYAITGGEQCNTKETPKMKKPKQVPKAIEPDPPSLPLEVEEPPKVETPPPTEPKPKAKPKIAEKKNYGEFVTLTEEEYSKLVGKYGEDDTKGMIEILDNYKGSTGKKYKSDYRTILNWVVNSYYNERQRYGTQRQAIYGGGVCQGSGINKPIPPSPIYPADRFGQCGTGPTSQDYTERF